MENVRRNKYVRQIASSCESSVDRLCDVRLNPVSDGSRRGARHHDVCGLAGRLGSKTAQEVEDFDAMTRILKVIRKGLIKLFKKFITTIDS